MKIYQQLCMQEWYRLEWRRCYEHLMHNAKFSFKKCYHRICVNITFIIGRDDIGIAAAHEEKKEPSKQHQIVNLLVN